MLLSCFLRYTTVRERITVLGAAATRTAIIVITGFQAKFVVSWKRRNVERELIYRCMGQLWDLWYHELKLVIGYQIHHHDFKQDKWKVSLQLSFKKKKVSLQLRHLKLMKRKISSACVKGSRRFNHRFNNGSNSKKKTLHLCFCLKLLWGGCSNKAKS